MASDAAPAPAANWKQRLRARLGQHEAERETKPDPSGLGFISQRFQVLRELGRGGMGAVLEVRDTRLDRVVALKLLLGGAWASPAACERFEIEARASARLQHPNIVSVYEVGHEGDQRYLLLELVPGESLAARLERVGTLSGREAARIAAAVARALAYAHAHAILHRDVKPANILLSEPGDEPKLADFGLAKSVEHGLGGMTSTGLTLGTPAYMPPEQALGDHERVDRRADVYALGATLYELLTGRPPFLAQSVPELLRRVLKDEPTPPRALRPELGIARDLETICLRCLEKEPERRYASASELADELERFLRHEPIRARPPSLGDRLRKWLRRNRALAQVGGAVGGAALVVMAVGAGLFVQRLQTERAAAERSAATARRAYEQIVFRVHDRLAELPYEDARAARAELIGAALQELAELQEAVDEDTAPTLLGNEARRRYAELLESAGRLDEAARHLEETLQASRRLVAAAPRERAPRLDLVQSLEQLSDACELQGAGARALELAREAVAGARSLDEEFPGDAILLRRLAAALLRLAVHQLDREDAATAKPNAAEGVRALRELVAREPQARRARYDLAAGLDILAKIAEAQGELQPALAAGREGLELRRRLLVERPGDLPTRQALLTSLLRLADLGTQSGDLARTRELLDEALQLARELCLRDPGNARLRLELQVVLSRQGDLLKDLGEAEPALALYQEAAANTRADLGDDPSNTQLQQNLAVLLDKQGSLQLNRGEAGPARAAFEEGLALLRPLQAANPGDTELAAALGFALRHLGGLEKDQGRRAEARPLLEEALEQARRLRARAPADARTGVELADSLEYLGDLESDERRLDAARALFREALALRRERCARDPSDAGARHALCLSLSKLGLCSQNQGAPDEALAHFEELRSLAADLPEHAPTLRVLSMALHNLGRLHLEAGQVELAEEAHAQALARLRRLDALDGETLSDRRHLAMSLYQSGLVARAAGDPQRAETLVNEAIERQRALAERELPGADDGHELSAYLLTRAELAQARGDAEGARAALEEMRDRSQDAGADEPAALRDLAVAQLKLGELEAAGGESGLARFEAALAAIRRHAEADPAGEVDVLGFLERVVVARRAAGDEAGSRAALDEQLALGRRLLDRSDDPERRINLARVHVTRAEQALARGEGEALLADVAEVTALLEPVIAGEGAKAQRARRMLLVACFRAGAWHQGQGAYPAARAVFSRGTELGRQLMAGGGDYRDEAAIALLKLGQLEHAAGDPAAARAAMLEHLALREALLAESPEDRTCLTNVFMAHNELARFAVDPAVSRRHYEVCLENAEARFTRFSSASSCRHRSVVLLRLAELDLAAGDGEQALARLRLAVANHERLASQLPAYEPELELFRGKLRAAEQALLKQEE